MEAEDQTGMKEALIHPKHPERICWGCERYCPANDLSCREERLAHPVEFYGYDWLSVEEAGTPAVLEPGLLCERVPDLR